MSHRGRASREVDPALVTSFSLTAWLLSLTYRERGEENVVLAVTCGPAALMWFFGGGPVFALLGAGVGASVDALGSRYGPALGMGVFSFAMAMGLLASAFFLVGRRDDELTWRHELAALGLSVAAGCVMAAWTT